MTDQQATGALHLIFSERGLANCLAALGARTADATLLLLQDAVYAATRVDPPLAGCLVLEEDLALRGIGDRLQAPFHTVDRHGFVDLTAAHSPIVSWS